MRRSFSSKLALFASLALAGYAVAQQPPPDANKLPGFKRREAVKRPVAPPAPTQTASVQPTAPPPAAIPQPQSLLQQPAHRAQVKLSEEGLAVRAENSNLSQILREISNTTGMKMEGFGQDERVFGSYGPGPARDVIGQLLEGTGYNVMMVGETERGAPRQLFLTPRNSGGGANAAAQAARPKPQEEEEEVAEPEDDSQQQPGAGPPPGQSPPDSQGSSGVKTPQQLLEELRKMREPNQNPQQTPDSQPPQ